MENAFNYSLATSSTMQGGDSRYNRLTQAQLFKEANPDIELEVKTRRVTDKVSETLNVVANEPSLAFFRIQEHVRKCLPQLVETKHEVQELQQKIQGSSFDAEYAANAVKEMQTSSSHFENIQDLLKNAIFMKQQIDYEKNRSSHPPNQGPATSDKRPSVPTAVNHSETIDPPVPKMNTNLPVHTDNLASKTESSTVNSDNVRHDQTVLAQSDSEVTLKNTDEEPNEINTTIADNNQNLGKTILLQSDFETPLKEK